MIADFEKQWDLLTPLEDITFNEPWGSEDWLYLLVPQGCSGKVREIRETTDPIPQADGDILHKRFTTGYQLTLLVQLMQDRDNAACGDQIWEMAQHLSGALRSLLRTQEGRVTFQEGSGPVRLIDQVRLRDYSLALADGGATQIAFTLDSPFPYSITFTQDIIEIEDGTEEVFNEGNVEFWPVFKVYGPESLFVIANDTTGESITFDASLPGGSVIPGGSYLEIDTFRNTAYLNGDGANDLPAFDAEVSDFFALVPGSNFINTTAADVVLLKNDAWD